MNKKLLIALIVGLVILLGLALIVPKFKNTRGNNAVDNGANLEEMKTSDKTSPDFDKVEIGDSVDDVKSKVGELTEEGKSSEGFDTYSFVDKDLETKYYFFFDNNKLAEVSVMYE